MMDDLLGVFEPPGILRAEQTKLQRAACIAKSLEEAHRVIWPGIWPLAECFETCLITAPAIRMGLEWGVRVVVGKVSRPSERERPHSWIETPDRDIVDPTYGQFSKSGSPDQHLRVLPNDQASLLGHKRMAMLSLDQEEYFRRAFRAEQVKGGAWEWGSGVAELFDRGTLPILDGIKRKG